MARTVIETHADRPPMPGVVRLLRETGSVALAVALATLSLANAVSEGIGLMLLVPILASLGADGAASGVMGRVLAQMGLAVRLEPLLVIFVLIVGLRALLGAARDSVGMALEMRVVDRLRLRMWRALIRCDLLTLARWRSAELSAQLIDNPERIGDALRSTITLLTTSITLATVAVAALAIAPGLAAALAAGGLVVLVAHVPVRRRAARLGARLDGIFAAIHGELSESLAALRIIKSFGREEASVARVDAVFANKREARMRFVRGVGFARTLFQLCGAALLAVMVWLAIRHFGLGAAAVLPMVVIFARALPLLGEAQEARQHWAHDSPAIVSAFEIINTAEASPEDDGTDRSEPVPSAVTGRGPALLALRNVSFSHAGRPEPSLEGITLQLEPASIVALSGPSGAGKSTVADIFAGLISPTSGHFIVNGAVVAGAARQAWRKRVAYVQQDPLLFHASVRANLLWAMPEATDSDLQAALRAASAGFVLDRPHGLDTMVGDRGSGLSGGERQRIALARGLLRKPDLLVLDEVTSALDAANEAAVAKAIADLRGRMTIVIIGHGGALAGMATHEIRLDRGRLDATDYTLKG